MKCPKCRKTKSKVIDSRPAKDKLSIRRRRECLACATRFTTFEATEVLVSKVTQLEMIELRNKLKQKPDKMPKKAAGKKSKSTKKKAARKKSRLRKKASKRKKVAGKIIKTTATDTIFKIISRFKRGVDIPKLKDRTGFDASRIRNILYQLSNQGKIKKISRGVYTLA